MANRIALHQWSVEHPEVRSERIESPWIIVGLPRTGTSVLSMLLGLDPMARPLLQWEAAHPIPPPTLEGEEGEQCEQDPRIAQTTKEMDRLMKLNPPLKAMHPFGATLAQECVSLFLYDIRTLALEIQAHVPTYARWLEHADMTPAYAQHRLALQTLQSRQPTERWILKTQPPVAPGGPAKPPIPTPASSGPTGTPARSSPPWPAWPTRGSAPSRGGRTLAPRPTSGSANVPSPSNRPWRSTRSPRTTGASTCTTTP